MMAALFHNCTLTAKPVFICQLPVKPSWPKLDFVRERMKERRFSWGCTDPWGSIHCSFLCCSVHAESRIQRKPGGVQASSHRRVTSTDVAHSHLTLLNIFLLCVCCCCSCCCCITARRLLHRLLLAPSEGQPPSEQLDG